jgi:HSP20 family protein
MNAIIKRNERSVPWDIFNEFDNVVTSLFKPYRDTGATAQGFSVPAVDVVETDEAYVVKTDLPGFKNDDINITLDKGLLTIKAEHSDEEVETQAGTDRVIRRERRHGAFARTLRVGDGVDETGVNAEFVDGVLHVTLPKSARAQARQIKVNGK